MSDFLPAWVIDTWGVITQMGGILGGGYAILHGLQVQIDRRERKLRERAEEEAERPFREWFDATVSELCRLQRAGKPGRVYSVEIERFSPEEAFAQRAVDEGNLAWMSTLKAIAVRLPLRGA